MSAPDPVTKEWIIEKYGSYTPRRMYYWKNRDKILEKKRLNRIKKQYAYEKRISGSSALEEVFAKERAARIRFKNRGVRGYYGSINSLKRIQKEPKL